MADIIDFGSRKKLKKTSKELAKKTEETSVETQEQDSCFSALSEKNKQNQERMKKERAQANKQVLQRYRIK